MPKAARKPDEKFRGLSAGERIGGLSFVLSFLLAFVDLRLSLMVLTGFVVLCFAAPFFPRSSFYLPVVSRGASGLNAVALTFDDGPDPQTTPELLRRLKKHRANGTFFVNGRKAGLYPHLIKEILVHGHDVANHSYSHDMLLAFRSKAAVIRDIAAVQEVLRPFGIAPLAFRPPAGITSPRLRPALRETGLFVVNFSCRARDGGNRWPKHLAHKILRRIRPGDIVLLHDMAPRKAAQLPLWVDEIDRLLAGVREKGLVVLPLAELIGRPVMVTKTEGDAYADPSIAPAETHPPEHGGNGIAG